MNPEGIGEFQTRVASSLGLNHKSVKIETLKGFCEQAGEKLANSFRVCIETRAS